MRTVVAVVVAAALATAGCTMPRASDGEVGPGGAPAEAKGEVTTAAWGERYTWEDGLAVEVSAPVECKPGEYAAPDNIERAVKVTVTVVNGTSEEFNAGQFWVGTQAQFGGKTAEQVFDSGGECGGADLGGTVLPGKSFETSSAFSVGKEKGELQIVLQPNLGAAKAIYVGDA